VVSFVEATGNKRRPHFRQPSLKILKILNVVSFVEATDNKRRPNFRRPSPQAATNLADGGHSPKMPTGRQGSQLRFYVQ
jgi:hypothetical protein